MTHTHAHTHHEHAAQPSVEARVRALESLLIEKGIIADDAVDTYLSWAETNIGPLFGARVIARAWVDPEFKQRLLADASPAIAGIGIDPGPSRMVVVESTDQVHNVVCCTLCSCYPWKLLGLPPTWYKSPAYRSRIVFDPRGVLREFGCEVEDDVEVRVWDSTSEVRYMVLPQRPAGTESFGEDELVELITRDALVGVARMNSPGAMG